MRVLKISLRMESEMSVSRARKMAMVTSSVPVQLESYARVAIEGREKHRLGPNFK